MEYSEGLLKELLASAASESETLEFKQELPPTKEHVDKGKFAKDVVGMANASGGIILYGIAEVNNCASKIVPITAESYDLAARRLQETLAANVEPKEIRVRFHEIKVDGGYVLQATVQRSYAGPHRVLTQGRPQSLFHIRSNTQVRELTHRELRDAFLGREHAEAAFRAWRGERLSLIGRGNTPWQLDNSILPLAVFHVAALESFERRVSLETEPFYMQYKRVMPEATGDMDSRRNLDGVVCSSVNRSGKADRYVQVFRGGEIEYVSVAGYVQDNLIMLAGDYVAKQLRGALARHFQLLLDAGLTGPAVYAVSVLGVQEATLKYWNQRGRTDRRDLIIPEIFVSDLAEAVSDVDAVARPILDMLWQCFDAPKCNFYNESGDFVA